MARCLLFGRQGQLGHAICGSDWFEGGVALGRSECDLEDPDAVRAAIRKVRPEIVVNAAAYTAVDRAEDEPERAHAINANAPAIMAEEVAAIGSRLIHYSTDYVFDGTGPAPYRETDPVAPLSVYGATKRAGEEAIVASGADAVILRTAWVYSAEGANFAKTMLRLGRERDRLTIVDDQYGAPTSASWLAAVAGRFAADPGQLAAGLYHCTADGQTTWHAYAIYFLECCREAGIELAIGPEAVLPIATADFPTKARRPANSVLDCSKLEKTLGVSMPPWRNGVRDLAFQLAKEQ
ncbi:MAG: dTDP-4-dehydrorhamnose reductase [Pseudomonadota bacterium]